MILKINKQQHRLSIANILNNFFIAIPIKKPTSPPNPTVVNSGLAVAAARVLSIATF
jgi:hypothetical protein